MMAVIILVAIGSFASAKAVINAEGAERKFLRKDGGDDGRRRADELINGQLYLDDMTLETSVGSKKFINGAMIDSPMESVNYTSPTAWFQMRMLWVDGANWQEDPKEKFWCWRCEGPCSDGDQIELDWCSKSDVKQKFRFIADKRMDASLKAGRFAAKGTNLCLTAGVKNEDGDNRKWKFYGGDSRRRNYKLKPCDPSNKKQLLYGFDDATGKFELVPHKYINKPFDETKVLSTHHDPRSGEPVYAALLSKARKTQTSYWEIYEPSDGTTLWELRCSSSNKCDACEGDCGDGSHCRPGLVCFQRNNFEAVPGCKGTGKRGTDYCYKDPNSDGRKFLTTVQNKDCGEGECGECEGDCDDDSDCQTGLKCFQRRWMKSVPGCLGKGEVRKDYCYKPSGDFQRI